ncbi:MAG: hypothetical protein Q4A02_08615 [Bacteroidales bacterium]|nr:hypothetical protein [Bacteroidales bacterium]
MGNIDEKRLSALLERIGNMKAELEALEEEVCALGTISGSAEKSVNEPERSQMPAFDETPIDISIQDIDISPVIEDPAAEYAASPMVAEPAEATTEPPEDVTPDVEPAEASENVAPAAEPVEATAEPAELAAPVAEPVEATGQAVNAVPDDLPFDDDLPADEPSAVPEPISEPTLDIEPEIVINPTSEEPTPKPKAAILDSKKAETAVMDVMAEKQAWRTDRPGSQVKNVISAISLNDRVLLINVLFREDPILFQSTISAFNGMTNLDEAISYIQTNFPDWDLNSEPVYRLMMAVRRKLR